MSALPPKATSNASVFLMLQKQSEMVTRYLKCASVEHERAAIANNPKMREFHEQMRERWMNLAASAALVERTDLFLQTARSFKNLPPMEVCRGCQRRMRIARVHVANGGETQIFECAYCGDKKERQMHDRPIAAR